MSHCAWYVQPWGSAYWMLTSSPASINCIVPLYGEVHAQLFGDGLVERNRERHSFLSKCEIVRVVRESRDAIMQETRAWGPEGHAEGVGSETPLLACMHVGDLHLKSSEAEAASQSRSHPIQSSDDSNKHVIATTATDHRSSRLRSLLPNHVRWASKVGGVKLQNCCRYVRLAGRATPCAISVETKNPVCICHDLLLSWRAATVPIELFQAHGA